MFYVGSAAYSIAAMTSFFGLKKLGISRALEFRMQKVAKSASGSSSGSSDINSGTSLQKRKSRENLRYRRTKKQLLSTNGSNSKSTNNDDDDERHDGFEGSASSGTEEEL